MIEVFLHACVIAIRFVFGVIFEIIIEAIFYLLFETVLGKIFEKLGIQIKNKNDELILGRINVLEAEQWFEPYRIYTIEIAQRKSIRKLILKLNMTEILSNEEKRLEFLNELECQLFNLNKNSIRTRKTSHM